MRFKYIILFALIVVVLMLPIRYVQALLAEETESKYDHFVNRIHAMYDQGALTAETLSQMVDPWGRPLRCNALNNEDCDFISLGYDIGNEKDDIIIRLRRCSYSVFGSYEGRIYSEGVSWEDKE